MSLADILGNPVDDSAMTELPSHRSCRVPEYATPDPVPAPRRHSRSTVLLALVAALATGVVTGWYGSRLTPGNAPAAATEPTGMPAEIAGYAELYTAQQLTGPTDTGEQPIWVNQTAAIAGEQINEHTWLVTVAMDSLELVDSVYRPAGLQDFNVLVTSVGGRPAAIGMPSRVPLVSPDGQSAALFGEPVPDEQAMTVVRFLEEYLTGGTELDRYLETPSNIAPFATAPYDRVEARPLGANTLGEIRVAVTASKENGITHQLEYVLTMDVANGTWVVADAAPAAG